MADEVLSEEPQPNEKAVDVFTHSSTGFPGAWTEEEIQLLLESWLEVVEETRPATRRFDVARKVLGRMRKKGFRRVEKDVIRKQMNTLRTEYKTYQGLLKIGIPTVRASCVTHLERILGTGSTVSMRRRQDSVDTTNHVDGLSEDSDHSHRLSVSYGEDEITQNGVQSMPEMTTLNGEEVSNQTRRVRFQRRMTLQRSIRILINQQQAVVDHLKKFFANVEESNSKIVALLEELVISQKASSAETKASPREEEV